MPLIDRITGIAGLLLLKRGRTTPPAPGENLREAGLTSLDMVNLMLSIEAEFGIEIPQNAMTPENFETVRAIEQLVLATPRDPLAEQIQPA
jgi:acyl carrier protein